MTKPEILPRDPPTEGIHDRGVLNHAGSVTTNPYLRTYGWVVRYPRDPNRRYEGESTVESHVKVQPPRDTGIHPSWVFSRPQSPSQKGTMSSLALGQVTQVDDTSPARLPCSF